MNNTLETLYPLLDKSGQPINDEAAETLRIYVAELDGCTRIGHRKEPCAITGKLIVKWHVPHYTYEQKTIHLPNYSTSFTDIFNAEARAGLHNAPARMLPAIWQSHALKLLRLRDKSIIHSDAYEFAFMTVAQRAIILILTLQWKQKQN